MGGVCQQPLKSASPANMLDHFYAVVDNIALMKRVSSLLSRMEFFGWSQLIANCNLATPCQRGKDALPPETMPKGAVASSTVVSTRVLVCRIFSKFILRVTKIYKSFRNQKKIKTNFLDIHSYQFIF